MTHTSCPTCRLRFERALAADLAECPLCAGALERSDRAASLLGLWLFDADLAEPQGDVARPLLTGRVNAGHPLHLP
jgi:hypothetical protein